MKKNLLFVIMLLLSTGFMYAQADKVLGIWLTEKKGSQVRVFKATDGKYYGKVEWLEDDKERLDTNNPDANLSQAKSVGLAYPERIYSTMNPRSNGKAAPSMIRTTERPIPPICGLRKTSTHCTSKAM